MYFWRQSEQDNMALVFSSEEEVAKHIKRMKKFQQALGIVYRLIDFQIIEGDKFEHTSI